MTKKHPNYFLVGILLLFLSISGQAQNTVTTSIVLTDLLLELEEEYDVKFSFADSDVADINIERPSTETLAAILDHIRNART
jgi:acyl carrier protein